MKKIFPLIVVVYLLSLLACGNKTNESVSTNDSLVTNLDENSNDDEEQLLKDAFKNILGKFDTYGGYDSFGKYFLYDITGDYKPELWIFADSKEEKRKNFSIYTFKDKDVVCIFSEVYDPMGTTFLLGEKGVYERYYTQGHEEINLFKYRNGRIVTEEVYSISVNPENRIETIEKGVAPECEEIKAFEMSDETPLNQDNIPLIQIVGNQTSGNTAQSDIKDYSEYVGTWKLNRTEAGQKMRIEVTLRENKSGEFVVFIVHGSRDEVAIYETYSQCILQDGVIYLTKNGVINNGSPKLKVTSDGLYSFDNEKYVR